MSLHTLLKQNWKKTIRARGFHKNIAVNILLGIIALYFIVIFFAMGLFLHSMLENAIPEKTPTQIFNGVTLYLLFGGLLIRYLIQQLATINIHLYQTLPVKRKTIVDYLLFSPLLSPVNYILFFTIIPFAVRSVATDYNLITALCFVLNFFFIVCFNSLTASYIKRKFGSNFWGFFGVIAFFGLIIALEYYKIFSLFSVSCVLFDFVVLNPFGLIVPLMAIAAVYFLNHQFFAQNFYAEEFEKKIKTAKNYGASELSFLNRFGTIGDIMALIMKLVWRHKRTKNFLFMVPLFLLYGLIFYTNDRYAHSSGWIFFCALFMTGAIGISFGQWLISWNGTHFDSLMTKNIPVRAYLSATFYLMLSSIIISFILTMPYFLFGKEIAIIHTAALLYNLGINTFLLTYFATYNTKRIDLAVRSTMNMQGTTYKNFLILLPMMLFPVLLIAFFALFSKTNIALIVISVLGILGLVFQKQLITICVNQFNRRKYVLCEGFRQSE
jgi:hypothetical protein